jgi:myo-inositol 2-dehydrogenase/D-chiro-inositol 1-dehydrogenase
MSDPKTVRFGVIGYGLFGTHHARAIAHTPGAELRAIAVPSEASQARARQDHPTATVYADYHELLARDDLDAVSVVVPNHAHYEVGREVLASGRHLLLEKPMALSVAECDELVTLARQHQRVLAVGHELRVSRLWGGVKHLLDAGVIGRPQAVLVELSRFPYRQGSAGWRYDRQRVGSWILEEPIHFFDLARWYLAEAGEPVAVDARGNSRRGETPELADHFAAFIDFPNRAYAVVIQTLSAFEHHQTVKVSGTEGTIWAAWSAPDARAPQARFSLRWGLGDNVHELPFAAPTGELVELADEIAAFVSAIQTGRMPPCTGDDGRAAVLLCLAAEASLQRGTAVSLAEFVSARPLSGGAASQSGETPAP